MGMKTQTHEGLVRACLALLEMRGCLAWPVHTDERNGRSGCPDITAVMPGGRTLLVEVKVRRDRVRPNQASFMEAASLLGALCVVVRDDVGVLDGVLGNVLRGEGMVV